MLHALIVKSRCETPIDRLTPRYRRENRGFRLRENYRRQHPLPPRDWAARNRDGNARESGSSDRLCSLHRSRLVSHRVIRALISSVARSGNKRKLEAKGGNKTKRHDVSSDYENIKKKKKKNRYLGFNHEVIREASKLLWLIYDIFSRLIIEKVECICAKTFPRNVTRWNLSEHVVINKYKD